MLDFDIQFEELNSQVTVEMSESQTGVDVEMSEIIVKPTDWDEITNKPETFPPSSHGHGWTEITGKPTEFPPSSHNHDDRYYTEAEIDAKIGDVVSAINAIRGV